MELSGEEKKLQALFSELKAVNEQLTPHFGATWNRAQIAPRKIRMFNPALVAVMFLLVFGVVAFAVWSRYSRTLPQPAVATAPPGPSTTHAAKPSPASEIERTTVKPNPLIASHKHKANQRDAMLAAANRKLQRDAKSIASWTSPTSALLESPSDEIFSSLPELNQSATQLKSFLPRRSN
jgi:hypothetical protein